MKQIKHLFTLFLLTIITSSISAQKLKVLEGDFQFFKGQKEFNVEFRYDELRIHTDNLTEQEYIDKTRNKNAQQLDTIASKEYRKGNISAAVSQWQKALKLAPRNNEIQEKLIRAKKVKNKLKKLSNDE